jgi:hypothetical protein
MHHLPLIFGAASHVGMQLVMIIAICGMILGLIMGMAGMYFAHQRQRLWHETARLALEKGQPIPANPDEHHSPGAKRTDLNQHDLRGGLVLIAVGMGVYFFLAAVADQRVAWLGAVPGFIGIALVVHWGLTRLTRSKSAHLPPNA